MPLVELNKKLFSSRLSRLYDGWNTADQNDDYSSLADADAIFLAAGDPTGEDEPMRKGTCIQQWLLGYEFPSSLFLFSKSGITVLCSASKAKTLAQIENAHPNAKVEILPQAKGKNAPNDAMEKFLEKYTACSRIGILPKEKHTGKTVSEWEKTLANAPKKPETVDITTAASAVLAEKDDDELAAVRTAGNLTSTLLKHHVAPKLESILDKELKISHSLLAAQIEAKLGSGEGDAAKGPDMKVWNKGKGLEKIDWDVVEMIYSPIIISRNTETGYELKLTAESSEDNIAHKGVLLVSIGMRYKSYCANLGRTFIVDPTKEQDSTYNLLLSLQKELLSYIKHGVVARDVYNHAVDFVKEKKPDLSSNFVKSIGFLTGVEFRDSSLTLAAKTARTVRKGMTLLLSLGFQDISSKDGKYCLQLNDTILVSDDKSELITEGTKAIGDTMFYITPDEDKQKKSEKKPPINPRTNGAVPKSNKTAGGKTLRTQRRNDEVQQTALAKVVEHQRQLREKLQEDGLTKYSEEGANTTGKESKGWKKFQSYKGEAALPNETERLRILVDRKAWTVILPIHGFAVPFHINTIKNASKNDEGDFTYLRINFQTPGQAGGARKEDAPFEDPDATFIRSVSYRSPDGHRFDTLYRQITDLKKEANKRDQQKKEMADVVEQDNLIELKNRRPTKYTEVNMRPVFDGKRYMGDVEIHQNGVRYISHSGQKLDVLFSNIKHLFFQPCDHELIVLIHLHLRSPIIIGKRKTHDVQFFKEASDLQFDETGNRKRKHRYGDEDEIEMEQQERKRRQMLNKETRMFAEKLAEAASASNGDTVEVDEPFRELSFEGVPVRSAVRLQPTTDCLVHLTDPPFTVVTLNEIEIASLERVQYGLKQFDMCLVFKDFTRPILHINSIQTTALEDVKNWLDSVDIPFAESAVNLNWPPIMKHINENPHEFFTGGGWSFLGGVGAAGESDSDDSESMSEFEAESEDFQESSSDDASDFSDASGSSGSGSFSDGSESEGEDWDDLEEKALKSDKKRATEGRKRRDSDDSDDDRPKKKSVKPNGKAGKGRR